MTFSDYLVNGVLIALVFRQIRGRRLTPVTLLLPLAIVVVVATQYLHAIPTAGNDLYLIGAGVLAGAALGTGCGLFTRVHPGTDGVPIAKAGWAAALLWVAGVGSRLAFSLYASNGGEASIGRFSVAHHITGSAAWVAALVLMALVEVVSRSGVLAWRGWAVRQRSGGTVAGRQSAPLGGVRAGRPGGLGRVRV